MLSYQQLALVLHSAQTNGWGNDVPILPSDQPPNHPKSGYPRLIDRVYKYHANSMLSLVLIPEA